MREDEDEADVAGVGIRSEREDALPFAEVTPDGLDGGFKRDADEKDAARKPQHSTVGRDGKGGEFNQ